jgi:hypothetical protein
VPAYDYSTGGEFMAPPVPYGHYAKDYDAAKALGYLYGPFSSLHSRLAGLFHGSQGNGCGSEGCGLGCGHGHGHGSADPGCGFCAGKGLFHHGQGGGIDCGGSGLGLGLGHKKHFAPCHASTVMATSQVQTAPQVVPSSQCGQPGCTIGGHHSHLSGLMAKIRCRFCGGGGCGRCGGLGTGDPCSSCGGSGHGSGLGHHGGLCGGCGGCGLGLVSGMLGQMTARLRGMLHLGGVDWFVGPGGPVPLTPGYVPYVVTTRSPRDFFAFPPMNPNDP